MNDEPAESTTGNVDSAEHAADVPLAEVASQTNFDFSKQQCSAPTLDSAIEDSTQSLRVSN